jgi:integrase
LRDAISAHAEGTHVEPTKMTLTGYLRDEWLPLQRAARKPSTFHGYEFIADHRIIPALGDTRLSELTSGDVARFLTGLRNEGGRRDAQGNELGLSERSIKNTFTVLHSALEHAVEASLLLRNPAARLPKAARPQPRRSEMHTWSADELRAFLDATAGERFHAAYVLAAMGGLRRSEILGLRWVDVDLGAGIRSVTRGRVAAATTLRRARLRRAAGAW